MTRSGSGRFDADELGVRGSAERRRAQRKAVMERHVDIVMAAAIVDLESGWLGPEYSPLGRDGHAEAVRRRIARRQNAGVGPIDATIVEGRPLLTIDAIVDEYFGDDHVTRLERALASLARRPARNDNGRRGAR